MPSPEEQDWYRNPICADPAGAVKRLVEEIFGEAVASYKMLDDHGVVNKGRLVGGRLATRVFIYCTEEEVSDLLDFFNSDKIERWLDLVHFDTISATAIREKLGITNYGTS